MMTDLSVTNRETHRPSTLIFRAGLAFGLLVVGLVLTFLLNIGIGAIPIGISEVWDILINNIQDDSVNSTIVWAIRLPRAIAVVFGGASLAVAGLLFQIFFRNPIVDSYVLGVSSGATFIMSLILLGGFKLGFSAVSPLFLFFGAFVGSLMVTAVILLFAYKVRSNATLLVIGLMIGYLCSSATGILVTFAESEQLKGFMIWTMGSFAGFTWEQSNLLVLLALPLLALATMVSKPLNAFLLGEDYAKSMGVNIRMFRIFLILVSSLLTAAVTAFAGPVAFIGMAVPHIARLVLKTSDNRILIPAVMLSGGIITALCDLLARTLMIPVELNISSVTSFFGVPVVIWLLMQRRSAL